ncbi:MAG: hypothetical protein DRO39_05585 [Thermoprotei archaeon]|nr:MAG: hypothetical protein DRO39_05585 [Thermoprotei archaeon]
MLTVEDEWEELDPRELYRIHRSLTHVIVDRQSGRRPSYEDMGVLLKYGIGPDLPVLELDRVRRRVHEAITKVVSEDEGATEVLEVKGDFAIPDIDAFIRSIAYRMDKDEGYGTIESDYAEVCFFSGESVRRGDLYSCASVLRHDNKAKLDVDVDVVVSEGDIGIRGLSIETYDMMDYEEAPMDVVMRIFGAKDKREALEALKERIKEGNALVCVTSEKGDYFDISDEQACAGNTCCGIVSEEYIGETYAYLKDEAFERGYKVDIDDPLLKKLEEIGFKCTVDDIMHDRPEHEWMVSSDMVIHWVCRKEVEITKPEDEVQVSREYENLVKELRKYAGYA